MSSLHDKSENENKASIDTESEKSTSEICEVSKRESCYFQTEVQMTSTNSMSSTFTPTSRCIGRSAVPVATQVNPIKGSASEILGVHSSEGNVSVSWKSDLLFHTGKLLNSKKQLSQSTEVTESSMEFQKRNYDFKFKNWTTTPTEQKWFRDSSPDISTPCSFPLPVAEDKKRVPTKNLHTVSYSELPDRESIRHLDNAPTSSLAKSGHQLVQNQSADVDHSDTQNSHRSFIQQKFDATYSAAKSIWKVVSFLGTAIFLMLMVIWLVAKISLKGIKLLNRWAQLTCHGVRWIRSHKKSVPALQQQFGPKSLKASDENANFHCIDEMTTKLKQSSSSTTTTETEETTTTTNIGDIVTDESDESNSLLSETTSEESENTIESISSDTDVSYVSPLQSDESSDTISYVLTKCGEIYPVSFDTTTPSKDVFESFDKDINEEDEMRPVETHGGDFAEQSEAQPTESQTILLSSPKDTGNDLFAIVGGQSSIRFENRNQSNYESRRSLSKSLGSSKEDILRNCENSSSINYNEIGLPNIHPSYSSQKSDFSETKESATEAREISEFSSVSIAKISAHLQDEGVESANTESDTHLSTRESSFSNEDSSATNFLNNIDGNSKMDQCLGCSNVAFNSGNDKVMLQSTGRGMDREDVKNITAGIKSADSDNTDKFVLCNMTEEVIGHNSSVKTASISISAPAVETQKHGVSEKIMTAASSYQNDSDYHQQIISSDVNEDMYSIDSTSTLSHEISNDVQTASIDRCIMVCPIAISNSSTTDQSVDVKNGLKNKDVDETLYVDNETDKALSGHESVYQSTKWLEGNITFGCQADTTYIVTYPEDETENSKENIIHESTGLNANEFEVECESLDETGPEESDARYPNRIESTKLLNTHWNSGSCINALATANRSNLMKIVPYSETESDESNSAEEFIGETIQSTCQDTELRDSAISMETAIPTDEDAETTVNQKPTIKSVTLTMNSCESIETRGMSNLSKGYEESYINSELSRNDTICSTDKNQDSYLDRANSLASRPENGSDFLEAVPRELMGNVDAEYDVDSDNSTDSQFANLSTSSHFSSAEMSTAALYSYQTATHADYTYSTASEISDSSENVGYHVGFLRHAEITAVEQNIAQEANLFEIPTGPCRFQKMQACEDVEHEEVIFSHTNSALLETNPLHESNVFELSNDYPRILKIKTSDSLENVGQQKVAFSQAKTTLAEPNNVRESNAFEPPNGSEPNEEIETSDRIHSTTHQNVRYRDTRTMLAESNVPQESNIIESSSACQRFGELQTSNHSDSVGDYEILSHTKIILAESKSVHEATISETPIRPQRIHEIPTFDRSDNVVHQRIRSRHTKITLEKTNSMHESNISQSTTQTIQEIQTPGLPDKAGHTDIRFPHSSITPAETKPSQEPITFEPTTPLRNFKEIERSDLSANVTNQEVPCSHRISTHSNTEHGSHITKPPSGHQEIPALDRSDNSKHHEIRFTDTEIMLEELKPVNQPSILQPPTDPQRFRQIQKTDHYDDRDDSSSQTKSKLVESNTEHESHAIEPPTDRHTVREIKTSDSDTVVHQNIRFADTKIMTEQLKLPHQFKIVEPTSGPQIFQEVEGFNHSDNLLELQRPSYHAETTLTEPNVEHEPHTMDQTADNRSFEEVKTSDHSDNKEAPSCHTKTTATESNAEHESSATDLLTDLETVEEINIFGVSDNVGVKETPITHKSIVSEPKPLHESSTFEPSAVPPRFKEAEESGFCDSVAQQKVHSCHDSKIEHESHLIETPTGQQEIRALDGSDNSSYQETPFTDTEIISTEEKSSHEPNTLELPTEPQANGFHNKAVPFSHTTTTAMKSKIEHDSQRIELLTQTVEEIQTSDSCDNEAVNKIRFIHKNIALAEPKLLHTTSRFMPSTVPSRLEETEKSDFYDNAAHQEVPSWHRETSATESKIEKEIMEPPTGSYEVQALDCSDNARHHEIRFTDTKITSMELIDAPAPNILQSIPELQRLQEIQATDQSDKRELPSTHIKATLIESIIEHESQIIEPPTDLQRVQKVQTSHRSDNVGYQNIHFTGTKITVRQLKLSQESKILEPTTGPQLFQKVEGFDHSDNVRELEVPSCHAETKLKAPSVEHEPHTMDQTGHNQSFQEVETTNHSDNKEVPSRHSKTTATESNIEHAPYIIELSPVLKTVKEIHNSGVSDNEEAKEIPITHKGIAPAESKLLHESSTFEPSIFSSRFGKTGQSDFYDNATQEVHSSHESKVGHEPHVIEAPAGRQEIAAFVVSDNTIHCETRFTGTALMSTELKSSNESNISEPLPEPHANRSHGNAVLSCHTKTAAMESNIEHDTQITEPPTNLQRAEEIRTPDHSDNVGHQTIHFSGTKIMAEQFKLSHELKIVKLATSPQTSQEIEKFDHSDNARELEVPSCVTETALTESNIQHQPHSMDQTADHQSFQEVEKSNDSDNKKVPSRHTKTTATESNTEHESRIIELATDLESAQGIQTSGLSNNVGVKETPITHKSIVSEPKPLHESSTFEPSAVPPRFKEAEESGFRDSVAQQKVHSCHDSKIEHESHLIETPTGQQEFKALDGSDDANRRKTPFADTEIMSTEQNSHESNMLKLPAEPQANGSHNKAVLSSYTRTTTVESKSEHDSHIIELPTQTVEEIQTSDSCDNEAVTRFSYCRSITAAEQRLLHESNRFVPSTVPPRLEETKKSDFYDNVAHQEVTFWHIETSVAESKIKQEPDIIEPPTGSHEMQALDCSDNEIGFTDTKTTSTELKAAHEPNILQPPSDLQRLQEIQKTDHSDGRDESSSHTKTTLIESNIDYESQIIKPLTEFERVQEVQISDRPDNVGHQNTCFTDTKIVTEQLKLLHEFKIVEPTTGSQIFQEVVGFHHSGNVPEPEIPSCHAEMTLMELNIELEPHAIYHTADHRSFQEVETSDDSNNKEAPSSHTKTTATESNIEHESRIIELSADFETVEENCGQNCRPTGNTGVEIRFTHDSIVSLEPERLHESSIFELSTVPSKLNETEKFNRSDNVAQQEVSCSHRQTTVTELNCMHESPIIELPDDPHVIPAVDCSDGAKHHEIRFPDRKLLSKEPKSLLQLNMIEPPVDPQRLQETQATYHSDDREVSSIHIKSTLMESNIEPELHIMEPPIDPQRIQKVQTPDAANTKHQNILFTDTKSLIGTLKLSNESKILEPLAGPEIFQEIERFDHFDDVRQQEVPSRHTETVVAESNIQHEPHIMKQTGDHQSFQEIKTSDNLENMETSCGHTKSTATESNIEKKSRIIKLPTDLKTAHQIQTFGPSDSAGAEIRFNQKSIVSVKPKHSHESSTFEPSTIRPKLYETERFDLFDNMAHQEVHSRHSCKQTMVLESNFEHESHISEPSIGPQRIPAFDRSDNIKQCEIPLPDTKIMSEELKSLHERSMLEPSADAQRLQQIQTTHYSDEWVVSSSRIKSTLMEPNIEHELQGIEPPANLQRAEEVRTSDHSDNVGHQTIHFSGTKIMTEQFKLLHELKIVELTTSPQTSQEIERFDHSDNARELEVPSCVTETALTESNIQHQPHSMDQTADHQSFQEVETSNDSDNKKVPSRHTKTMATESSIEHESRIIELATDLESVQGIQTSGLSNNVGVKECIVSVEPKLLHESSTFEPLAVPPRFEEAEKSGFRDSVAHRKVPSSNRESTAMESKTGHKSGIIEPPAIPHEIEALNCFNNAGHQEIRSTDRLIVLRELELSRELSILEPPTDQRRLGEIETDDSVNVGHEEVMSSRSRTSSEESSIACDPNMTETSTGVQLVAAIESSSHSHNAEHQKVLSSFPQAMPAESAAGHGSSLSKLPTGLHRAEVDETSVRSNNENDDIRFVHQKTGLSRSEPYHESNIFEPRTIPQRFNEIEITYYSNDMGHQEVDLSCEAINVGLESIVLDPITGPRTIHEIQTSDRNNDEGHQEVLSNHTKTASAESNIGNELNIIEPPRSPQKAQEIQISDRSDDVWQQEIRFKCTKTGLAEPKRFNESVPQKIQTSDLSNDVDHQEVDFSHLNTTLTESSSAHESNKLKSPTGPETIQEIQAPDRSDNIERPQDRFSQMKMWLEGLKRSHEVSAFMQGAGSQRFQKVEATDQNVGFGHKKTSSVQPKSLHESCVLEAATDSQDFLDVKTCDLPNNVEQQNIRLSHTENSFTKPKYLQKSSGFWPNTEEGTSHQEFRASCRSDNKGPHDDCFSSTKTLLAELKRMHESGNSVRRNSSQKLQGIQTSDDSDNLEHQEVDFGFPKNALVESKPEHESNVFEARPAPEETPACDRSHHGVRFNQKKTTLAEPNDVCQLNLLEPLTGSQRIKEVEPNLTRDFSASFRIEAEMSRYPTEEKLTEDPTGNTFSLADVRCSLPSTRTESKTVYEIPNDFNNSRTIQSGSPVKEMISKTEHTLPSSHTVSSENSVPGNSSCSNSRSMSITESGSESHASTNETSNLGKTYILGRAKPNRARAIIKYLGKTHVIRKPFLTTRKTEIRVTDNRISMQETRRSGINIAHTVKGEGSTKIRNKPSARMERRTFEANPSYQKTFSMEGMTPFDVANAMAAQGRHPRQKKFEKIFTPSAVAEATMKSKKQLDRAVRETVGRRQLENGSEVGSRSNDLLKCKKQGDKVLCRINRSAPTSLLTSDIEDSRAITEQKKPEHFRRSGCSTNRNQASVLEVSRLNKTVNVPIIHKHSQMRSNEYTETKASLLRRAAGQKKREDMKELRKTDIHQ